MPTVVRTQKHYTSTQQEPLHQTAERVELVTTGQGQPLAGTPRSRQTPPDNNSKSTENPDKTPSARAKVLPWVHGIETEGYQPPEGMFGPYDSQPATRVQTMHEAAPPQQTRPVHPFAYSAGGSLPFSALAGGGNMDMGATEYLEDQARPAGVRPESEVLSRGAGMRYLSQPALMPGGGGRLGQDSPTRSGSHGSGIGTFGLAGNEIAQPSPLRIERKAATHRSHSPQKATASPIEQAARPAPTEPLPSPPKAKSYATSRKPVPPVPTHAASGHSPADAHVHHPHHDFPFSHAEAAKQQANALEAARAQAQAQALAQLEATPGPAAPSHAPGLGIKGPRGTFETGTSGPSFGHLQHQDGHPVPGRLSLQRGPTEGGVPMARDTGGGPGGGAFFRIPFGVPMGAMLPRPMMVMRTGTGMGLGIGVGAQGGPMLPGVAESPDSGGRREVRSAYVESVEDEQEPTVRTAKTGAARTARSASPSARTVQQPARTESGIHPLRQSMQTPAMRPPTQAPIRDSTPPPDFAPPRPVQSAPTRPTMQDDLLAPTERTHTKTPSVASQAHTRDTARPSASMSPVDAVSIAPTTASNVKKLVADSKFHDETLCQLLDAARLNLIGNEAKKALNRAARARVIELRELRVAGEVPEMPPLAPSSDKKHLKSKDKPHCHGGGSDKAKSEKGERVEPTTPPAWAQEIIGRLAAFDARFAELEKLQQPDLTPNQEDTETHPDMQSVDLINDLIFNELHRAGFPPGFGSAGLDLSMLGLPSPLQGFTPQGGAFIRNITPTERPGQAPTNGDELTWGSEVEMPQPGDTVPPPRAPTTIAPAINIQAPTESNAAKTATRVPSVGNFSRGEARSPRQVDVDINEEQVLPDLVMPDPRERDLPPPPSESIRSNRPSPAPQAMPLNPAFEPKTPVMQNIVRATTQTAASPRTPAESHGALDHKRYQQMPHPQQAPASQERHTRQTPPTSILSPHTADAVTALTRPAGSHNGIGQDSDPVHAYPRDKIHVVEPHTPHATEPAPWDLATQRLYSWAMVWEEDSFIRALENISLGKQVEEFGLTVFSMMTFKRLLRRNLSSIPPKQCEKMFIPPNMSDAINKAVHSKNFANAQQILEELWYPFGFTQPPRVIIALAKHRNKRDHWTAHRFDLTNGHLTSYLVTDEEKTLADGRPFMWWHAIREAWQQHRIPHPDHLRQRVEIIQTAPEERDDNSLKALCYARNLLIGFRPESARDLVQLRETIWQEVKRLLQKKRAGKLVVAMDSPDHVDEL